MVVCFPSENFGAIRLQNRDAWLTLPSGSKGAPGEAAVAIRDFGENASGSLGSHLFPQAKPVIPEGEETLDVSMSIIPFTNQ